MKVTIVAVGRQKAGPERELLDRYLDRANAAGKRLGLSFAVREIAESPAQRAEARKGQEEAAILAGLSSDAPLIALDEGGKSLDSRIFADRLAGWRADRRPELAFVIGGADGLGGAVLDRASLRLAFGAMTLPHQLVRVLVAEQLYRAVTILTGHPYHRD